MFDRHLVSTMESLPQNKFLEFNPDTLEAVRKEFNLDKPGRIAEAIDILEDWVKKQNHFEKKDFSREYLERTLISTKGLVERAKVRMDKLCTFKTLLPHFFENDNAKKEFEVLKPLVTHGHLPKMTKDNYRVYFSKIKTDNADSSLIFTYYKYIVMASEYIKLHDYVAGFILVLDYTDINVMSFVTKLNIVELRQALALLTEGYGMRVKGIHLITPSKMIDALVSVFKQVLSEKLANRIKVHKSIESLYEYVPKNILPKEYGGEERSLQELNDEWVEIVTSTEHMDYMKMMNKAKTNESCRQQDKFNENYVGMPGSFRSLSVD